ncbi:MAG: Tim44 domain-containing protein, partial [Comamonadaceae bacterium]
MKKLGSFLLVCAMALVSVQADAARVGGGKSMGRQSNNVTQREAASPAPGAPAQNATNAAARPGAAAPAAAAPKRPWGAMLGGLAAGLGLAWLANSLGLGAAFGNILLIGLLVLAAVVIWRVIASRSRPAGARQGGFAFGGAGSGPGNAGSPAQYSPGNVGNDSSARPWERQNASFDAANPAASGGSSMAGAAGVA